MICSATAFPRQFNQFQAESNSMNKSYEYWLPDHNGEKQLHSTETNSIVIVGANGTGKSMLGAWIEQQGQRKVHRIGAQRNINISEHIPLKSFADASNMMQYGGPQELYQTNKNPRWNWGAYTTTLLNDFDDTLAALIALHHKANDEFAKKCKECNVTGGPRPDAPETPLDRVMEIWNGIFTERILSFDDDAFTATVKRTGKEYPAREMSDGERSVLYLASQVLAIPSNDGRIIIMDEPEVHLNRSLLMPLWSSLESARQDCLFVYITHDVDFASSHSFSQKIWVKDFDGSNWDILLLQDNDLPEELVIRLLGNRKPVLFVEGQKGSLDNIVYSAAFPNYQVVPVGGCTQVIENVRTFRRSDLLNEFEPYGIIDCDYRSDESLTALEEDGIFHLGVAEVENLFLTEPVLKVIAERLAPERQAEELVAQVKDYVLNERFLKQRSKHEQRALVLRLKNELSALDISSLSTEGAAEKLSEIVGRVSVGQIVQTIHNRIDAIEQAGNYEDALLLLNDKSVVASVGHFFGVDNKRYVEKATGMLSERYSEDLLKAMRPYLPSLPPLDNPDNPERSNDD